MPCGDRVVGQVDTTVVHPTVRIAIVSIRNGRRAIGVGLGQDPVEIVVSVVNLDGACVRFGDDVAVRVVGV